MPTLAVIDGFRFFFWSLDLGEPPHVHIEGYGGKAKFGLLPVELQSSRGCHERQLNKIQRIIEQHAAEWLKVWHEHFG